MKNVCFYFQVHQPFRLRRYSRFESSNNYFDDEKNREIFLKVAKKCYLPANKLMLDLIKETDGKFKISYSITGTLFEQAEMWEPEVIESFKELAKTGSVEFLDETYYHSISFLIGEDEFKEQIKMHNNMIKKELGQTPTVFRNTEAVYSNYIGEIVHKMGYKGIIAEGWDKILEWRSPNYLYKHPTTQLRLLLRNYKLSDDVGFRFSQRSWNEYPLTADKYAKWIKDSPGETINLFMDYETFGEHHWEDKGIFEFLKHLPRFLIDEVNFSTPSEIINNLEPKDKVNVPDFISWADVDRDLSAWFGNKMQTTALEKVKSLKEKVYTLDDKEITDTWRKLQTSDHFYYMCTKWFNDGDVHKYFNVYDSPYTAYINYMNVLNSFSKKIEKLLKK